MPSARSALLARQRRYLALLRNARVAADHQWCQPRSRHPPAGVEGTTIPSVGITMPSHMLSIARSLMLDRAAAKAFESLESAGVPSILLKGAAIANWLYMDGSVRPYLDIDLLVSPLDFDKAREVLAGLGYVPRVAGADPSELGAKELDLLGQNNICIDLHHGLIGASGPPEKCWDTLAGHTTSMPVGGAPQVRVLDVPARAAHLALHAAQNGPVDVKAITDLQRGLKMVERSDWEAAAKVADEIEAQEAFAAGLRLVGEGRVLAAELGLTRQMSVELVLRARSATQDALFFERVTETTGANRKMALFARKLFPTVATLRAGSSLARRGALGALCAWAVHPFSVAMRLGPAFIAWHRARRAASATSDSATRDRRA